jgi:hypothetical protein
MRSIHTLALLGSVTLAACAPTEADKPTDTPRDTSTATQSGSGTSTGSATQTDTDTSTGTGTSTGTSGVVDADQDGVPADEDCDDTDALSTVVAEDADCDGALTVDECDEEDPLSTLLAEDGDCDGVRTADDCDDHDNASTVVAGDADCGGVITALDCDDTDASVHPGAPEVWNDGVDQDCDGVADVEDASCSASLTLTMPDGSRTALDFCADWSFQTAFEYDPDVPPKVISFALDLSAATAAGFQCDLVLTQEGVCGAGYYDARDDAQVATLATMDCRGVVDAYETTVSLGEGYLRLDTVDAGDVPGSYVGFPLRTELAGRLHLWGDGFDLDGDIAFVRRQLAPDAEEQAACTTVTADADGDGYEALYFDGLDCADSWATIYPGQAVNEPPEACGLDTDGDGYLGTSTGGHDCSDMDPTIYPGSARNEADPTVCGPDGDNDGFVAAGAGGGDCDDGDVSAFPGAAVNEVNPTLCARDHDGDGYGTTTYGGTDCDDNDSTTHPAVSGPDMGVCGMDADGDGYVRWDYGGSDCNDADSDVSPAAGVPGVGVTCAEYCEINFEVCWP